jgi:hypothetical protein
MQKFVSRNYFALEWFPSSPPSVLVCSLRWSHTQRYRRKGILTSSNLYKQIATDYYEGSAVFLLVSTDHPLNESLAVLKALSVLQHLSELCGHLEDPVTKDITLKDVEYCTVITANKIWYSSFLKYYTNMGLSFS